MVGGGQGLEGTGNMKQQPLELMACDVSDEQSAMHVRYSPKRSLERD